MDKLTPDMTRRIEEALNILVTGASGNPELERDFLRTFFEEVFYLRFVPRQRKYTSKNIARRGEVGVLIRMEDKLERLDNYYFGNHEDFTDETVIDSWADAADYGVIGLLCLLGLWPGAPQAAAAQPKLHLVPMVEECAACGGSPTGPGG